MRTRAMRHKAWLAWWLAWRSPPRLSRWRSVRPEDAGMGAVPHRCAKAASERSRWGLSPAVTSSWPAVSTPIPGRATRVGAAAATSSWSWRSSWSSSAWSCCQRRARVRSVVLVAAVGLVRGPGRIAAHNLTRALVLEAEQGLAQFLGGAVEHAVELLGGGHPGFEGAAAGHPQDPDHLHLALAGLGDSGGHPGQGGPGGSLGVDRVGLAVSSAGAAVGPVDLDDLEAVGAGEAGQPSPIGAGAFDPDAFHRPKALRPG